MVRKGNLQSGKVIKTRRRYDEGCIAAHALDLVGDRWALLLIRELMLGPRRFGELRDGLPGISANVLTVRLAELEAAGLLQRQEMSPTNAIGVYALTEPGLALWPVLRALCQWGAQQPGHDPRRFISPASLVLSMRAMCARDRAGAHHVNIRAGDEDFQICTAPGSFSVTRGADEKARLSFAGSTTALASAIYGPQPLALLAGGAIVFDGDVEEGQAFLDLFNLRN